ncbi:D-isomer specific 2-hydroxyacid dehydrogenase [Talaromyces proteolyticus]|uniref:D-isomer specific 2-hydroxyacid dehydrogenase n=1 Tax=Talaromyces proteolyticus TaxID=1131652 RepID=A0AAD4KRY6_9EURO|nr:D-isomer specific 2-hydroxyacid dehydrogenase [Talaromyces proteolyticus]KAH8697895.1 D-isomer specific 2-hydroxyacid dehydrogenase [Talaromyces proteolyticus]
MAKLYVLDPYHPDALSKLLSTPNLTTILPNDPAKQQWKDDAVAIMLRSETRLTEADIAAAKNLKFILKQGVGVDNIDLDAAKKYGIQVFNTPALNSEAVAELSIALALAVARRVTEIDRRIRAGEKIVRSKMLGRSLFRKAIGIVGMGNIGRVVAKKWIGAMEGNVIAYDPYAPEDAWKNNSDTIAHTRVYQVEELLSASDVVSLHVPLTSSTRGLIGSEQLKIMKKEAILLNCARGGVVDEKALLEALKTGEIGGVALDASDVEPPTVEVYGEGLLSCDNVIMTPHIGASTMENQSASGIAVVDTLLKVLGGEEVPNRLV